MNTRSRTSTLQGVPIAQPKLRTTVTHHSALKMCSQVPVPQHQSPLLLHSPTPSAVSQRQFPGSSAGCNTPPQGDARGAAKLGCVFGFPWHCTCAAWRARSLSPPPLFPAISWAPRPGRSEEAPRGCPRGVREQARCRRGPRGPPPRYSRKCHPACDSPPPRPWRRAPPPAARWPALPSRRRSPGSRRRRRRWPGSAARQDSPWRR